MQSAIKGVLLDIGGVLVELDGMPSLSALLNGIESHETLHQRWMASRAVIAHETGKISAREFAEQLAVELDLPIRTTEFLEALSTLWGSGSVTDLPSSGRQSASAAGVPDARGLRVGVER